MDTVSSIPPVQSGTPLTAAKVVIDGEPTIVPKNGLVSECITVAKIDLKAGQTIDGIGGYTTYGSICRHEEAKEKGYVPMVWSIIRQS